MVTERVLLGGIIVILLITVLLLVWAWQRARRSVHHVDEAVMEALQRMSMAMPDLRHGLTQQGADRASQHLLEMLKCVAVGITDANGTLLSWDGEANEHYMDLAEAISEAIEGDRREVVQHEDLPCHHRGTCPMRTAVITPLIVDGVTEGVLVVVGGVSSRRKISRMVDGAARFVCIQLELARLDRSKQQLAQAEIKALRAQISPHFVYNALNTISSLIRTDPERARDLLQEFADFTRYSFRTSGMFTTLSEELRNIDRYLTIESARFEGRLGVRLKIAPEVLNVVVPFLVVQPLVENAVRHGLADKPGGGTVTVIAQDNGSEALLSVEDDGIGMDPDRLFADLRDSHKTGAHVGLGNINQRMRSVFGDEYALMVETAPDAGMKVTLRVPKFAPGVRPDLPDFGDEEEEPDAKPGAPATPAAGPRTATGPPPASRTP
ncbi:MAG: sensor histidine kinase, partial [Pseudonocardiaceae bacterium]|nr:sensor histidine kinase [Pseudonocardiaceae bacterium]